MKITEMRIALRTKNSLLVQQARRINLLEEKMTEWRKKYFQLKYASIEDERNNEIQEIIAIIS